MLPAIISRTLSDRNPIMREEARHQWALMLKARVRTIWIVAAALLLIPALIASIAAFFEAFVRPLSPVQVVLLPREANTLLLGLLTTMTISMHVVLVLVTLSLAANAITRERRGLTWEPLLLTGMSAPQIVLGKWWASISIMWSDFMLLAALRVGLLAWVFGQLLPQPLANYELQLQSAYVLFGAGIITLYTLVDVGFSAAVGLLATMINPDDGTVMGLGLALRVIAAVGLTLAHVQIFARLLTADIHNLPLALLLSLGLFALLLVVVLGLALWAARWQGVLRAGEG